MFLTLLIATVCGSAIADECKPPQTQYTATADATQAAEDLDICYTERARLIELMRAQGTYEYGLVFCDQRTIPEKLQ